MKNLKYGKAPGLDRIGSEIIKVSIDSMVDTYKAVFNSILVSGCYQGYITSIHKKGSICEPCNFRGITINNIVGKIFGTIMNSRLKEFVEKHKLMSKSQISTSEGARTTDHIFVLRILFEKYVKKEKGKLYACFIDFQKAYDRVWRVGMLYKLQLLGIKLLGIKKLGIKKKLQLLGIKKYFIE